MDETQTSSRGPVMIAVSPELADKIDKLRRRIIETEKPPAGRNAKLHGTVKAAFLEALAYSGSMRLACAAVGIHRDTPNKLANRDPSFRKDLDDAIGRANEILHDEAWRRAVDGWERPIYQRGELVGHERQYSDRLLEILLRAHDQRFKERATGLEITGPDGQKMGLRFSWAGESEDSGQNAPEEPPAIEVEAGEESSE